MKNEERIKKLQEDLTETSRDIWLAGLGLFSAAEEEGEKLFGKFVDKGKDLIAKGEKVEKKGKDFGSKKKDEMSEKLESIVKFVEEKTSSVMESVGLSSHQEVHELTEKVDKLTDIVAGLARRLDESLKGNKTSARPKAKV